MGTSERALGVALAPNWPAERTRMAAHPWPPVGSEQLSVAIKGEPWQPASAAALGGSAWDSFSAVCWLMGRDIHDGLKGEVPIGLISSNWGGVCSNLGSSNLGRQTHP